MNGGYFIVKEVIKALWIDRKTDRKAHSSLYIRPVGNAMNSFMEHHSVHYQMMKMHDG